MSAMRKPQRLLVIGCSVMLTATGCAFQGLNSLPLPGAVGRGPDAKIYHVEIANVATLESNSPVMIGDVVVGSVGNMTVRDWHADVEVSVKPDVVVPANAVATVGQTSLLGSMHLALNPPIGQQPSGQLQAGSTIPLDQSSTYPTTEKTLASLAAVVNGGGLGQIGDIIHNFSTAMSGRESDIRDLLVRLDKFIDILDRQRENLVAAIQDLNRLAGTFAGQSKVIERVINDVPPALDVLIKERPRITTALQKLGTLSDTATRLSHDSTADLVTDLKHLEPTVKALADIGPDLPNALGYAPNFPYSQSLLDRGVRGDYLNLFGVIDLTIPRLKRTLFLGTRWGEEHAKLIPAPGDPWYLNYTYEPMSAPLAPPPPGEAVPPGGPADADQPMPDMGPMPAVDGPILPVVPPSPMVIPGLPGAPTVVQTTSEVFAGPYQPAGTPPAPVAPVAPPADGTASTGGGG
jgi:phospholipid/cholesterol/gamma-HCH transport system substrate-binding protein